MKNMIIGIYVLLGFTLLGNEPMIVKADYKYESTVVINILKHTPEEMETVNKLLIDNYQITREYQCLSSGIIVLHVKHNFSQPGDVKHLIYKKLKNKISKERIDILFVDTISTLETGQC